MSLENAREVLKAFRIRNAVPGSRLYHGQFNADAFLGAVSADAINTGLPICARLGWVRGTPDGSVELTEAGYAVMMEHYGRRI
jgi:hypothetical protein